MRATLILSFVLALPSGLLGSESTSKPAETPPAKTPSQEREGAPKPRITLKWSTASEVDNYGFLVLRGDEEKGPFRVLTAKAIPGAGTSEVPREYRYEDLDVTLGRVYFYYLESISSQGAKEKFSPILKRTCCGGPPEASPTKKTADH
jgi:hypothetical protein